MKEAKVLVVGSGGLGCPLLLYLAAAGVGKIGIVDFDVVDETNLQRQVLFTIDDVGKSKAQCAATRIKALNPHIEIEVFETVLNSENALEIISGYDVVADGTDNFPTRYLVKDACVLLGKVNVYASIFRFDGQVSVFNFLKEDGSRGPNYRDIFPEPPPPGMVPSCAEGGVIGVLPGILGSLQANEVIKVVAEIGEPLVGRLFLIDALTFESRTLKFGKDENNPISGQNPTIKELIDYEEFCGTPSGEQSKDEENNMKEVTVKELKQMIDENQDFQLIDIREDYEYDICNLGAEQIPMGNVMAEIDKLSKEKKVVLHCRSGGRSGQMIQVLEQRMGFENLYNLKGGILAWADEIDPSMAKY